MRYRKFVKSATNANEETYFDDQFCDEEEGEEEEEEEDDDDDQDLDNFITPMMREKRPCKTHSKLKLGTNKHARRALSMLPLVDASNKQ